MRSQLTRRYTSISTATLALVAVFLFVGSSTANAAASDSTSLSMDLPVFQVNEKGTISAQLTRFGAPVPDAGIDFYLDGIDIGRSRTNEAGIAFKQLPKDLSAGSYNLLAVFSGITSRLLLGSQANDQLEIAPAVIQVTTVPPVAGLEFKVSGIGNNAGERSSITDGKGQATFRLSIPGTYEMTAPVSSTTGETRVNFKRWQDDNFTPSRTFKAQANVSFQAGYEVSYLVSHSFFDDVEGNVQGERVGTVKIVSSQGERYELGREPIYLAGRRAIRGKLGLEATEIQYSVESVSIDGSNVVNRSQQRFYPSEIQDWSLQVKLFTLELSMKDAFLGRLTGSDFTLVYPDGNRELIEYTGQNPIVIRGLARGEYLIELHDAVMAKTIPISMTKDQSASVQIVTKLDVAGAFAFVFISSAGLFLIGRSGFWKRLFVPRSSLAVEPIGRD
jgi:hypothetical protein